jgi:hypothetical protein
VRQGAAGYLITDWGDWGHHQPLPVSYLGYAAGAAYAWSHEANRELDLPTALDAHVFHDPSRTMGRLAHDLGNVYQAVKTPLANGSRFFWTLLGGEARKNLYEEVTAEEFDRARETLAGILPRLASQRMRRADARLVAEEFAFAGRLLDHACRRGRYRLNRKSERGESLADELHGLTEEHRRIWRARNREGGLRDSAGRLERAGEVYGH